MAVAAGGRCQGNRHQVDRQVAKLEWSWRDVRNRSKSVIFTELVAELLQMLYNGIGSVESSLSLTGELILTIDTRETMILSVNEHFCVSTNYVIVFFFLRLDKSGAGQ